MKTPLYDRHLALGARMTSFAGWEMPVQYAGIVQEHLHTREAVSLFDTSHLTEFRVWGARAEQALARALAVRLEGLEAGRCRYGFLLGESGGVLDDLIVYRVAFEEFMVVANASMHERDAALLDERLGREATFEDISQATAMIAVQGPRSLAALEAAAGAAVPRLPYYGFTHMQMGEAEALVSRTGYTGELGFELYVAAERAGQVWERLLAAPGVEPAGLGARDTLRLEMGYPLYGHELHDDVTPLEARLDWALPEDGRYVGAESIERQRSAGVERVLVGVLLDGRRAARPGDVARHRGEEVGRVTSGCYGPSLGRAVAMAYVKTMSSAVGTPLQMELRGATLNGSVVELPFYRNGTVRRWPRPED